MNVFGKKIEETGGEDQLVLDIREVCGQMDAVYARFEFENDADLIEASIYEIESLKARYRYLLKMAKEKELKSDRIVPAFLPKKVVNDLG